MIMCILNIPMLYLAAETAHGDDHKLGSYFQIHITPLNSPLLSKVLQLAKTPVLQVIKT